jgi:hypothetical protein
VAALVPAQGKDVGDQIVSFVAIQMKVRHPCVRRLQEGAKRIGVVDGMRATAANVGTPVLAPVWADGATTWQELHQVSARRFPAATSPISCAVRGQGEAARMAATAGETWRRVCRAMQLRFMAIWRSEVSR